MSFLKLLLTAALCVAFMLVAISRAYISHKDKAELNSVITIAVDRCDEDTQNIAEQMCFFTTKHKCAIGCEDYHTLTALVK